LRALGAHVVGLSLPAEHADGAWAALAPGADVEEVLGDVRDAALVRDVVGRSAPDVVLHLAAQALVRRSHRDPLTTYATNVDGAANVLAAAKAQPSVRAVVVVTSDKVYADTSRPGGCREDDPLGGADPYSASKACAELVVRSWRATYPAAPPVVTARAGNVIGGGDRGEDRLVPDVLQAFDQERPVRLRNPRATRPWQFVLEPLSGYLAFADGLLARPDEVPPALNFGPSASGVPVAELVEQLGRLQGRGRGWEPDDGPAPPEAQTLALDPALAARALGWRPRSDMVDALTWTLRWHEAQRAGQDLVDLSLQQIAEFSAKEHA
jgi:CDP-glucose 4,6-dehydratase